jgi:hypothetical protein
MELHADGYIVIGFTTANYKEKGNKGGSGKDVVYPAYECV